MWLIFQKRPWGSMCRQIFITNSIIWHKGLTKVKTRPTLKRRKTLGHNRSINPNTINHFANESQNCEHFNFFTLKAIVKTDEDQLQIWCSHSSANNHNIFSVCHSRQVNVATWIFQCCLYRKSIPIVERALFITYMWFATICINYNIIWDFSTAIQQF